MKFKSFLILIASLFALVGGILAVTAIGGGNVEHAFAFWGEHLIIAAIWLMLSLSLNLINGCCGLFSLGHQGFWMIGAYAAAATVKYLPPGGDQNWLGFILSFPIAVVAAAAFGLLVGIPCLRLSGDYLAIATLAFSEILRNLVENSEPLGKSLGLSPPNVIRNATTKNWNYAIYLVLAWAGAALTMLVLRNLMRSSHGRAIQAIRDDERAAELLGVNLTFYKVFVFVTGAAFAGLAGALFANFNAFVSIGHFSFNQGVMLVVMVVLGGMGDMGGTTAATIVLYFVGNVFLKWLPSINVPVFYDPTQGGVVWTEIRNLWQVFFSVLLIVVVLVRPEGLLKGIDLTALFKRRAPADGK
ncbi:MAG TPA: branched-chain amino acid ABC transporter permease [Planctomycetota bacterium]|nr:branched-chain amino acid ABC transporter permease [Planctomycetota bacterium]